MRLQPPRGGGHPEDWGAHRPTSCTGLHALNSRISVLPQQIQAQFGSFDILSDESIRQGLKEHSNWPTYPQLYVKGELVGGCDIVEEMASSGELASTLAA